MNTRTVTPILPAPKNSLFPARTLRTFLAEDSPLLMALLARIVSKDERVFIVGSAVDGCKAVCNARSLQPDLVITDLHMPGLDGAEATRLLKQQPNPPIVFVVTSDDTPEARARSMAAGADALLLKAGNLAPRLLSAIQGFLPDDLDENDAEPKHSVKDSPQSNKAALAGDENSTLLRRDRETRQACVNCGAEIVDGHWFCRLPGNEESPLLRSPSCALHYFERAREEANGSAHDLNDSEQRFQYFATGEKP